MTGNDIIKALECCKAVGGTCKGCAFGGSRVCIGNLHKFALDLINRQQAVIERYEKEHSAKLKVWELLDKRTKERYEKLYEEAISVVRAEAIEAFADKVKENRVTLFNYIYSSTGFGKQIDDLVKEMVGEEK